MQSEWCRREVETFAAAHAAQATDRIVPVFKNEPDRVALPSIMQGDEAREGFLLFARNASGQVNEFYWRGLRDQKAYFDRLREVAESIIHRLGGAGAPPRRSRTRQRLSARCFWPLPPTTWPMPGSA